MRARRGDGSSARAVRSGLPLHAGLVLLVFSGAGGCSSGADDPTDHTVADTTTFPRPQETESRTPLDSSAAAGHEVVAEEEDPFAVFGLEGISDVRATNTVTPVWLVNGTTTALVVTGDAGAGRVVIDTIPAEDSVIVRIQTRGASVRLEAETLAGESGGAATVPSDGSPGRVAFPR